MADAPPPSPPGWFPDPDRPGYDRYWDGGQWTDRRVKADHSDDRAFVVFSYVAAAILPPIGFVLGIALYARKQANHGLAVILVSITVTAVACQVLVDNLDDDAGRKVDRALDRIERESRDSGVRLN